MGDNLCLPRIEAEIRASRDSSVVKGATRLELVKTAPRCQSLTHMRSACYVYVYNEKREEEKGEVFRTFLPAMIHHERALNHTPAQEISTCR